MGVLRKGEAWHEKDYKSPKEIVLRELIERKRAEQERLKKLEEVAFDLAVEEWSRNLSSDEVNNITQKKGLNDITPKNSKLRLYFLKRIFGKRLRKIILYKYNRFFIILIGRTLKKYLYLCFSNGIFLFLKKIKLRKKMEKMEKNKFDQMTDEEIEQFAANRVEFTLSQYRSLKKSLRTV